MSFVCVHQSLRVFILCGFIRSLIYFRMFSSMFCLFVFLCVAFVHPFLCVVLCLVVSVRLCLVLVLLCFISGFACCLVIVCLLFVCCI